MTLVAHSSIPPQAPVTTTLTGWGGNLRSDCYYTQVEVPAELERSLDRSGTVARGPIAVMR